MELVTVHTSLNLATSDLVRSRLEAAGFHPVITHDVPMATLGYALASGGILVQVPDQEAREAAQFLKTAGAPPAA